MAQGDILYRGASAWKRLVAGTSGKFLKTQGASADPIWDTPSGSGTVTNTGTLTSGTLVQGNGGVDVTLNATTATVTKLTAGVPSAATDGTDYLSPSTGTKKLAQIITSSSQATVDFTSISGAFSSLLVVFTAQDTTAGTSASDIYLKINNDGTSGNYTSANRIGVQNGGVGGVTLIPPTSGGAWVCSYPNAGNTGMAADGSLLIPNYAATTFHKAFVANHRAEWSGNLQTYQTAARWKSTAAITRLTFSTAGTAFTDGSTFTLYGLP